MATMHCFLRDQQGDLEDASSSIVYGPSTQNKIERWWRELLERMEMFFKMQLAELLESGDYDPTNDTGVYNQYTEILSIANKLLMGFTSLACNAQTFLMLDNFTCHLRDTRLN
jgi:hypothetical protein